MAGDVNPIYQRLNGVQDYHPFTANTFADWSLEAGDIVSINRGGATYSGPTQMNTVKWTGQQQVTVEAPGEQTRGSVARMSAETYSGGNGGGNSYRSGYRRNTKEKFIGERIKENADNIELEAWNRKQADNTFEASLKIQADRITAEVKNRKTGDEELSGKIEVEAGKITQMVDAVGKDGKVTAASIVAAINGSGSEVVISADHIRLSGNTTINDIFAVQDGLIIAKAPIKIGFGDYSQIRQDRVRTIRLELYSGAGQFTSLGSSDILNMVTNARVEGNTLYLYRKSDKGNAITFKRATSVSGIWSGTSVGESAIFTYKTDDESIAAKTTTITMHAETGKAYITDENNITRASIDVPGGGEAHTHSIELFYDSMEREDHGSVVTYTYYYRYTRNYASKPLGDSKVVWW